MKKLFLALSVLTIVPVSSLQARCCSRDVDASSCCCGGYYARNFMRSVGGVMTLGAYNPACSTCTTCNGN